jgi:hypothetical protein
MGRSKHSEAILFPSGLNATLKTAPVCPLSVRKSLWQSFHR